MKKDSLYFLQKLIAFKTLSHDTHANEAALAWIKKELQEYPLYVADYSYNTHPCLVLTTQKDKQMDIMLQAHLDVVDGTDTIFQPIITDDKLIGRGSFDMKFAIAAYMALVADLKHTLPQYNFGIVITTDEEIGGFNGMPKLLEEGYSAKACLLPDGGENWVFQAGAKGVYQFELLSKGISAHGARPWLGKNAIETLMTCLLEIKPLFLKETCGDETHLHNTMTIGKIEGGKSTNQVAAEASARIDIRFIPPTSLAQMRNNIDGIIKKYPDISLKELSTGNSYLVDKENPYLRSFLSIAKHEEAIDEQYLFSHGSSDARFLIDKGISTFLVRPVGGNLHSENEWISIKGLMGFYTILRTFIEENAK